MNKKFIIDNICLDLKLKESSVLGTVALLEEDATVPFISRYRKEKTGGLDETQVRNIYEKLQYYSELEERKDTVLNSIRKLDKLTPQLEEQINKCVEREILEDLYLPYKPKRRTRATIAKEKGLEPLADLILSQNIESRSRQEILLGFINAEKGVTNADEALRGALDIVAEKISDDSEVRGVLRDYIKRTGVLVSKVKKEYVGQKTKFENYYNFSELLKDSPSHRVLAIRRGSKEEVLSWKIEVDEDKAIVLLELKIVKKKESLFSAELIFALSDSYRRLIFPSLEIEVFLWKVEEAESEAINVFSKNLRKLLLAPPAGHKIILGVDPGFRTGCKLALIDRNGDFRQYSAIFPHPPQNKTAESQEIVLKLVREFSVELICIGNGTASKETAAFINSLVEKNGLSVKMLVVNEAGASVYSASELAVKEFPDLDVTVRGAISIARRLQDPLAELVKIDAKSIGVGQYQHDVNQAALKRSLEAVVESCVNYVGVELNSGSAELLTYVSGIGKSLANSIVQYRSTFGGFKNKLQLLQVPKLGEKIFEQCAGFLRISAGDTPLDNSAIHPESYSIVQKMAQNLGVLIDQVIGNEGLVKKINVFDYVTDEIGIPTLTDILQELKKPGCDPRKEFVSVNFDSNINAIEDLKVDMVLEGVVTNVTNFGAFVDIGVHHDALIHISRMSSKFVKDPHDIICVGDFVKVKVIAIDKDLKRIGLSMLLE